VTKNRISGDEGEYCPYLDSRDERCGEHLTVNDLSHAFHHCFGDFVSCPVFKDKFISRRVIGSAVAGARHERPRVVVQVYVKRHEARVPVEST